MRHEINSVFMKRSIITLFALLAAIGSCRAADDAQAILRRTADYVKRLGDYGVSFVLTSGDYASSGRYAVSGDVYYIAVDNAEVYSDGKTRYEVNHARKEVSVDDMDAASRNILDNPTRCFDFVGTDYRSEVASRDGDEVTLHLRAVDPEIEGDIYLTVSESTGRPSSVAYSLYDDRVTVRITDIYGSTEAVRRFDRSTCRDYEMIDFR